MGLFHKHHTLHLFAFAAIATAGAPRAFAGGSKPPDNQKPPRQKCSYLCDEIPREDEILASFGRAAHSKLPSKDIRVLAWNIYKERKPAFRDDFAPLSRDRNLILLSEMSLERENQSFFESLPGFDWVHSAQFFMKDEVRTGVGNGSDAEPTSEGWLRTKDLEPFVKSPKVITWSKYTLSSGSSLLALNIHGINFKGVEGLKNQLEDAAKVIRAHKGPVLFAGDFNTKDNERWDFAISRLGQEGLKRVPLPYDKKNPPLDGAFVRGLTVKNWKYLVNLTGSDHPAIVLDLSEGE